MWITFGWIAKTPLPTPAGRKLREVGRGVAKRCVVLALVVVLHALG